MTANTVEDWRANYLNSLTMSGSFDLLRSDWMNCSVVENVYHNDLKRPILVQLNEIKEKNICVPPS